MINFTIAKNNVSRCNIKKLSIAVLHRVLYSLTVLQRLNV